ncbi:hypothetical protein GCM10027614_32000 [Micromonospora vulcania]
MQSPAQRLQRARDVADHGGVRHREAGHLDPPPVVAGDRVGADPTVRVGDQLGAGGGQLAKIVADRRDQRLGGVVGALATGPADLVADEGHPLAVPLELDCRDHGGTGRPQPVGERLALGGAQVQHQ